jgi:hypothetical protein
MFERRAALDEEEREPVDKGHDHDDDDPVPTS